MKSFIITVLTALSFLPEAQAWKETGGGDLCEKRILEIGSDISDWIAAGGAAGLKFPPGVELAQYNAQMKSAIVAAKVRCVKRGDSGYPVQIGTTPKVCRFDRTATEQTITCDYETFMNRTATSESDQYILVHHELAGLAGLENPDRELSTYSLSSQISDFLEQVTIKKLAVRPARAMSISAHPRCTFETMRESVEEGIKAYLLYSFESIYGGYPKLEIDRNSVKIKYHGLLDYQDHYFLPNQGVQKEHAFEVTFKSMKGTEFALISVSVGLLDTKPPLNPVFSVPEFLVEKQYDSEGNLKGLKCVVKTHRGYNRNAISMNISSGKIFKNSLISSEYGTLIEKDISDQ